MERASVSVIKQNRIAISAFIVKKNVRTERVFFTGLTGVLNGNYGTRERDHCGTELSRARSLFHEGFCLEGNNELVARQSGDATLYHS